MALPDVNDVLLDRLVLCAAEITVLNQVTRFEPPVKRNDKFPMLFFELGELVTPLNSAIPQAASNHFVFERLITAKLLIRPIQETQLSSTEGTHEDEEVRPFIALLENYFGIQHQFLGTNATPGALTARDAGNWTFKLMRAVQIRDSGIRDVPDRYTVDLYHGCIFTLNCQGLLIVNQALIGA